MSSSEYNYIIIGSGAAGFQLALRLAEGNHLHNKKLLIIEKDEKNSNDRTWCYWEQGAGRFDDIVFRQWQSGLFITPEKKVSLSMGDYTYKMIRSSDFYSLSRKRLAENPQVTFRQGEVLEAKENGHVLLSNNAQHVALDWIFDSRMPVQLSAITESIKLMQHFLGWIIRTDKPFFNPSEFTMMDYRGKMDKTTSFFYILPFSEREALVEFTFFNQYLIKKEEYERYLQNYIKNYLHIDSYEILEMEQGIIPMTDHDFGKYDKGKIVHIGTAGGWVKPSTGYSFRNTGRYIDTLMDRLKTGKSLKNSVVPKGKRWYDAVFLTVLHEHNERGETLFKTLYERVPTTRIFRFLDETSNFLDELSIMSKFTGPTFTKAFFKVINRSILKLFQ